MYGILVGNLFFINKRFLRFIASLCAYAVGRRIRLSQLVHQGFMRIIVMPLGLINGTSDEVRLVSPIIKDFAALLGLQA